MNYDLIIIGSGPSGYVSAIRAGQLGMKTLIIEKEKLGGMCLNWGCIPSKSLIESAKLLEKIKNSKKYGIEGIDKKALSFNWKNAVKKAFANSGKLSKGIEFLLKKNNVEVEFGEAEITDEESVTVNNRNIKAKNIIISTGSFPQKSENEIDITDLYELEELPEKIAFAGHGPVSVELAQMAAMAGLEVYIITDSKKLIPELDDYANEFLIKKLKKHKIAIVENSSELPDEIVVVNSKIRKAVVPKSKININLTDDGFIETNDNFATNISNIFAVGDVNGKSAYAHLGSAQGLFVVNNIKGVKNSFDFNKYPINIYTYPEIAQIGKTEQAVIEDNIDYKLSSFPLSANGKALISGDTEGEVRIISEKKYGEVLGVTIISENATDMIAEAAAYMSIEGTVYDIAATIHAHPSISEVFMEAGLDAGDKAIHK